MSLSQAKKNPNFIIGGACAGGTSFLSSILKQHKQIFLPKIMRPEPNFFHYSHKFSKGINSYLKIFKSASKNQIIGERSSLLLTSKKAPLRIKKYFPSIKLIFCLRNPIERAWANYRFTCLEGLENKTFYNAIKLEKKRKIRNNLYWKEVSPYSYIERGKYYSSLKLFLKLFKKKNILIIKSEDLSHNTSSQIKKVCSFIGIKKKFKFKTPENFTSPMVINISKQRELRAKYGRKFYLIIEKIRQKKSLKKRYNDIKRNLKFSKEPMDNKSRIYLRTIFHKNIKKLSNIIDFNTEDWI